MDLFGKALTKLIPEVEEKLTNYNSSVKELMSAYENKKNRNEINKLKEVKNELLKKVNDAVRRTKSVKNQFEILRNRTLKNRTLKNKSVKTINGGGKGTNVRRKKKNNKIVTRRR